MKEERDHTRRKGGREGGREGGRAYLRMQAMGASVNMSRTITPAKYHDRVPYRIRKIAPSDGF